METPPTREDPDHFARRFLERFQPRDVRGTAEALMMAALVTARTDAPEGWVEQVLVSLTYRASEALKGRRLKDEVDRLMTDPLSLSNLAAQWAYKQTGDARALSDAEANRARVQGDLPPLDEELEDDEGDEFDPQMVYGVMVALAEATGEEPPPESMLMDLKGQKLLDQAAEEIYWDRAFEMLAKVHSRVRLEYEHQQGGRGHRRFLRRKWS